MSTSFPILDLVIGLIFIFFLFSIATSSAVEAILTIFRARARILEHWLKAIFNKTALGPDGQPLDTTVGQAIMDHCLTTVRADKGNATPYMSAANFVSALLDKITLHQAAAGTDAFQPPPNGLQGYITAITNSTLISNELKRTFIAYAQESIAAAQTANAHTGPVVSNVLGELKTDMDIFRKKLEDWFNDTEDRFTDKLKRGWTTWLTALFGTIIVVSSNVDTINIAKYLYGHKEVTEKFSDDILKSYGDYEKQVAKLQEGLDKKDSVTQVQIDSAITNLQSAMADIKNKLPATIPMGWRSESYPEHQWYSRAWHAARFHFFGWVVTILAIMLGAPFWFDLLGKIANIRGTGPKPAPAGTAKNKTDSDSK